MSSIAVDFALSMADSVPQGGLPESAVRNEATGFRAACAGVQQAVADGKLGFWNLPSDSTLATDIQALAAELRPDFDDVLVLGIGGSSLGARALVHALAPALTFTASSQSTLRLHFPDNSDPWLFGALLERVNPARTLVLVVSKSGGTVETAAQLLCARAWLEARLGRAQLAKHIVTVTDPEHGTLRALTRELSLRSLPIASNVGGRFCVLSAAGLLPAALAGIDIAAVLQGAQAMALRCAEPELFENPAGMLAVLHVLHMRAKGHRIHVLMPYADALRPFAAWYVQLWAESLGKRMDRRGRVVEVGPTPLPAVGATDQHSQVQLFVEGPRDKLVTFVSLDSLGSDVTIPATDGDLSYLCGHSLGALLAAELRGTALALARAGRPSLHVRLPRLDAASIGGLFFLYQAATAFAGELLDIDAFDQPGVEEGKRLAFGLLGRSGYESQRDAITKSEAERPERYRIG